MEKKLELERKQQEAKGLVSDRMMMTPPIDEDYWLFRVKLYKDQALLAFPKFMTFGIGFAKEDDWNTNLPYQVETEDIYEHIKHNKKYDEIGKEEIIEAIKLLQKACKEYQENALNVMVTKRNPKINNMLNLKE